MVLAVIKFCKRLKYTINTIIYFRSLANSKGKSLLVLTGYLLMYLFIYLFMCVWYVGGMCRGVC